MTTDRNVTPIVLILKGNTPRIADGMHRKAVMREILAEIAAEAATNSKSNH